MELSSRIVKEKPTLHWSEFDSQFCIEVDDALTILLNTSACNKSKSFSMNPLSMGIVDHRGSMVELNGKRTENESTAKPFVDQKMLCCLFSHLDITGNNRACSFFL
jgi:hypothetical protein